MGALPIKIQLHAGAYFIWPDIAEVRETQQRASGKPSTTDSDGLVRLEGRIWIPDNERELQLKLLVAAHCGAKGHRGKDATRSELCAQFTWRGISKAVDALVDGCLHCIVSRTGDMVPRPLATALHGTAPNEVIHTDFLYLGPGTENRKYALILRDDFSSYVWLFPCSAADADSAAESICSWVAAFGAMEWLVSDQGSHFKNELIEKLADELRSQHHFTTAYSPWANGTVERVCREVLRACRALCSEWRLGAQDWPTVIEAVQSVLNHSPLRRLGPRSPDAPGVYRTPLEVYTGHTPRRPLLRALPPSSYPTALSQREADAKQLLQIQDLQTALEEMHRDVDERVDASRKRAIRMHNEKTNVQKVNFHVGDFVLVRRAKTGGHKLAFKWAGVRRVVEAKSALVFVVEDLESGSREIVHARRLILYRANMDGKDVNPKLLEAKRHLEYTYQIITSIKSVRQNGRTFDFQVEWAGLPEEPDHTWEPGENLAVDVPEMLEDFLSAPSSDEQRALKQRARTRLSSIIQANKSLDDGAL